MFLIVLELLAILALILLRNRQNFKKAPEKTAPFEDPQIRANPWIGILQEDVYKDPSGPVGKFTGKIIDTSTPTYEITSG